MKTKNSYTTETYIAKAKSVHGNKYDYSKTVYEKYNKKITVTCPVHGDFLIDPGHHINSGSGCRKCSGTYQMSQDEFIERSNKIHNYKYDYSKVVYKNKQSKITIICPMHGEFQQRAEDHYLGHGCRKCYDDKHTENQTFTKEEFLRKCRGKFGYKYTYDLSNYKTLKSKITITCPEHGTYKQPGWSHLKSTGCPYCGRIKANKSESLTQEEFLKRVKEKQPTYDFSQVEYVNFITKVKVRCPEHGIFEMAPAGILCMGYGCPKCGHLKSQNKLLEKLQKRFPDKNFIWEYRPKWLNRQRIDIALPDYKIGIEYDGLQHFETINYFGGKQKFLKQKSLDFLKEKRCNKNDFKLFRIKYNFTDESFEELCDKIKVILNGDD